MDHLLERLGSWRPFTAAVIGDLMLDQVLSGDAERLSGDAPVPVLHVRAQNDTPGGAANLCLDLAALRARVVSLGVVGDDAEGRTLTERLGSSGVETAAVAVDPARPTTVKRNLVGLAQARHPQKMFRLDVESRDPLPVAVEDELLASLGSALREVDVVCIEDYNKGVCSARLCARAIGLARDAGKPVFVDPASITDYAKYRGATAITPNRTEAEKATGLRASAHGDAGHNAELARRLLGELDLEAVVLTLDRHGALLLERGAGAAVSIPTVAREVYDVTGAGDMMLAGLAAGRANGLGWADAVRLANAAAGLEVEVFGVQPIPLDRVHAELLRQQRLSRGVGAGGVVRSVEELEVELRAQRAAGRSVVFTNGCFDVLHEGHVELLERAKREGDFLVVAINSDRSVARYKGPNRPVNGESARARVLAALAAVDAVVVYDEDTPVNLLERIGPDVLVKGGEYTKAEVVGAGLVESAGGRVVIVGMVDGASTTETLRRLGHPSAEVPEDPTRRDRFVIDPTVADASAATEAGR